MTICEEEAEIIRQLFELLVFKDYGSKELREFLAKEKGIKVAARTVRLWMQETAYIGTFHMNKKGSILGVGQGQKTKHYMKSKEEWVAVERPDLAIVDKRLFDLAQKIMESRKIVYDADKNGTMQARFKGTHLFSGKVFCEECGKSYTHCWVDRNKTVAAYRDSYVQKRRDASTSCNNKDYSRIYEDELAEIVRQSINLFIKEHMRCFDMVLQSLKVAIAEEIANGDEEKKKRKQLENLNVEAEKILQTYLEATGAIRNALSKKYEEITQKISELKEELAQIEHNVFQEEELERRIQVISSEMDKLKEIEVLDRNIVENFVDRIIITKEGKIKIILKVGEIHIEQLRTWQEQKERKRILKKESASIFYVYSQDQRYEIVVELETDSDRKQSNGVFGYWDKVIWVLKYWIILVENKKRKRKRYSFINRPVEVWVGILYDTI
ncbi:MAG: recombinase family protein [Eubacteriales bacterium]|nr:recombinase family protein [Eubacteriales bacterium]